MNAVEIEEAISILASQPFDAAGFPFAFLEAFGNKETTIKRLRSGESNKSDLGGILQTSNIHIKVCAEGEVTKTLAALKASPATTKAKAKFVLATDGKTLEAEDLSSDDAPVACAFADFPDHFGFFLPLAGITTVKQIRESSFDIRATSRLNRLYVELLKNNPAWGTAARRPDMNHFMARLIFLFFAEDTDILNGEGLFTATIEKLSERDSSNTHEVISELFRAMNIPTKDRASAKLPRWANLFPYVNGGLFSGSTEVPRFSKIARSYLLHIGHLDWRKINPDIFGSMIQAVADDDERGALGMHYTSVPNILKVLNPLFLDDIREKLDDAGTSPQKLLNLRKRMARIRVFDPACGSGNFLVIAYKEMRAIEAEINKRRGEADRRTEIPLTNFRGIELRDFPAEIARLALIIAEYQCDVTYRGQKEALAELLPLDAMNWITCGNALRLDWLSICPPTGTGVKLHGDDLFNTPLDQPQIDFENEGGETYICGNPPYVGGKKLSAAQKDDMTNSGLGKLLQLDYVCCWLLKFVDYHTREAAAASFVCTSSVCQGEQVGLLWPLIHSRGLEIRFCYRPFKWQNNAQNNAGVMCCVIGLGSKSGSKKLLYADDSVKLVDHINPYLIEGKDVYVVAAAETVNGMPAMCMGSNPVDGTHLVLSSVERSELVARYGLETERFVRRYVGGTDILRGTFRYCLWISDEDARTAREIPLIGERLSKCEEYRRERRRRDAKKVARVPHRFCYRTHQDLNIVALPKTSSSAREYVPADLFKSGPVVNVDAFAVYDGHALVLSLLSSKMHNVWLATTSGRLGDGYRYSVKLSYNNFPVPVLTQKNHADLTRCAEDILMAREAHWPATISDLYDPETMPANLRAAHERNDEVTGAHLHRPPLQERYGAAREAIRTVHPVDDQGFQATPITNESIIHDRD